MRESMSVCVCVWCVLLVVREKRGRCMNVLCVRREGGCD